MLRLPSFHSLICRPIPLRNISSSSEKKEEKISTSDTLKKKNEETLKLKETFESNINRWMKAHDIYYGKDRDFVNFPSMAISEHPPKVRMGIIPESWFNALYPRTGVTGPYVLFFGGILFLVQKEVWIMDQTFNEVVPVIIASVALQRLFGPIIAPAARKIADRKMWALMERKPNMLGDMAKKAIEISKEDTSKAAVAIELFQAHKENIGLQLETVYRSRIQTLHKAVQNRLDYHAEKEQSRQRFQRSHMINWIVDGVIKDFTAQQEKVTMTQCISNLKAIAQSSRATPPPATAV